MLRLKSSEEIARIRNAGRIVAEVLATIEKLVQPGVSTLELDAAAESIIRKAGAVPSFLGYGEPPFPGSICASIDEEVVHGIPSASRILKEGQIISIDVGAYLEGYHADAARTFGVGAIDADKAKLIRVTEDSFWAGLAKAIVGNRIGDVSAAVQAVAEAQGYGVVRELTGHGVGRHLHEDPDLPNYGHAGRGLRLEVGLVLAMEPMINMGTRNIAILEDGWTIITKDHKPSAHYENTFAITADGPVILTAL
ncbi:MAG: map [Firmicutes bacterium]|nr:map [Bacillota bacterium]